MDDGIFIFRQGERVWSGGGSAGQKPSYAGKKAPGMKRHTARQITQERVHGVHPLLSYYRLVEIRS